MTGRIKFHAHDAMFPLIAPERRIVFWQGKGSRLASVAAGKMREERFRLAPPVQAERPGAAFLPPPARPLLPLLPPPETAAAAPAAGGEGAP